MTSENSMHDLSYSGDDGSHTDLSSLLNSLRSTTTPKQEILLIGDDRVNTYPIDSKEVDIVTSIPSGQVYASAASNKVKTTPVVNYDWESRYYCGNLVAVHRNGVYMAYVLHKGKSGGVVRLINRLTAERVLLKDFNGRISDLAFEIADEVMLAVMDEMGQAYVYRVDMALPQLTTHLALLIRAPILSVQSEYNRLIWCPYIPEDGDDSDESLARILLVTRGEKAEIWYIDAFLTFDGSTAMVSSANEEGGVITIDSHTQAIVDAAFAPDASAVATAGLDGNVKFFQADIVVANNPRCLHQWQPHDGRPLSSLCFLDDHKSPQKCLQFWKYCVTGADQNTELKVWTCQTWTCLQTIRFLPSPSPGFGAVSERPSLKTFLDPSATYLILSDIKRKVLYALELYQDNTPDAYASFMSISEFLLAQPCLSFVVTDAKTRRFKQSLNDSHLDEITTGELDSGDGDRERVDDDHTSPGVHIKMFSVHAKMLQELQLTYKTGDPASADVSSASDAFRDGLSDLSMDTLSSDRSIDHPILMTPDAFTSHLSRDLVSMEGVMNSLSTSSSLTHVTPMHDELLSPQALSSSHQAQVTTPGTVTPSSTKDYSPNQDPVIGLQLADMSPKSSIGEGTPRDAAPLPALPLSLDELDDAVSTIHGSMDSSPRSSFITTSVSTDAAQFNGLLHQQLPPTSPREQTVSPGDNRVISPTTRVTPPEYDENDEEVAEVLAEENIDTEDAVTIETEDVSPDDTNQSEAVDRPPWPKPPDMTPGGGDDVDSQAQRLAELAIDSACSVEQVDNSVSVSDDTSFKQAHVEVKWDSSETHDASKDSRTDEDDQLSDQSRSPRKGGASTEVMSQLQTSLSQILVTVQQQQRDLNQLRAAMRDQQEQQLLFQQQLGEGGALREAVGADNLPDMDAHFVRLEEVMAARVERILSQQALRNHIHLEQIVSSNQDQTNERHDQLVAMVTQSLNNTIPNRVEKAVHHEIKTTVVPNMTKVLEVTKERLHGELARKLTATDALLKENITKLVNSKQTVKSIGQAASTALQGPIQATYKEAFASLVVPSFEASCQTMYRQVNETFHKGTLEYTNQLQAHVARVTQTLRESRDPYVQQLHELVNTFKASAAELLQTVKCDVHAELQMGVELLGSRVVLAAEVAVRDEVKEHVSGVLSSFQESLVTEVRAVIKSEVTQLLSQHTADINDTVANAVRSTAPTPVPSSPFPTALMSQITQLVRQGLLNAAFDQALTASNIDLVTALCKLVDPTDVFNQVPCPLQQPVLLSLIQQLSADMMQDTELKHKYLSEAIMTLDPTHPITQEHMKSILHPLCQKLKVFTQSYSQHPMAKSLRMLLMAAQSLLNQG